ncbi:hypothetical protein [Saccharothrix texasensis]|uniref:Uncharacterized protein n=1 Tax=Saccharothrix texasensis TaxID=103734 RepID=A0A3N1HCN0_9PSEU|nr:hypothetical protein [Saccharothrix texasensis]ROP40258.1 hypothetical protein EDD40_5666 [Saccharothrix texasensis]
MTAITRPEFVAAPLLVPVCGVCRIVDGVDGERGPGPARPIDQFAVGVVAGWS